MSPLYSLCYFEEYVSSLSNPKGFELSWFLYLKRALAKSLWLLTLETLDVLRFLAKADLFGL